MIKIASDMECEGAARDWFGRKMVFSHVYGFWKNICAFG